MSSSVSIYLITNNGVALFPFFYFFFFLKKGSLTALMVYDLYVTVFFFVHRVEFTALARDYKAVNLGQVINYKYRF